MIITRTPLRISLVGGGSDLPAFYKKHEKGAVLSMAIDKYVYVVVNKRFEKDWRISYSITEIVPTVAEIKHDIVRNTIRMMGLGNEHLEIVTVADVPGRGTGLGSSSSLAVGLIHALNEYRSLTAEQDSLVKRNDYAEMACEVEIDMCWKKIGKQDQYAACFGGLNKWIFPYNDMPYSATRYYSHVDWVEQHSTLFYTGMTRKSAPILEEQSNNMTIKAKFAATKKMVALVDAIDDAIMQRDSQEVARILNKNWELKKTLAHGISNPDIDLFYNVGMDHNALGGKLLGAGGGGFLYFWVEPDRRDRFIEYMSSYMRHVPFKIDTKGTQLVYMTGMNP